MTCAFSSWQNCWMKGLIITVLSDSIILQFAMIIMTARTGTQLQILAPPWQYPEVRPHTVLLGTKIEENWRTSTSNRWKFQNKAKNRRKKHSEWSEPLIVYNHWPWLLRRYYGALPRSKCPPLPLTKSRPAWRLTTLVICFLSPCQYQLPTAPTNRKSELSATSAPNPSWHEPWRW